MAKEMQPTPKLPQLPTKKRAVKVAKTVPAREIAERYYGKPQHHPDAQ